MNKDKLRPETQILEEIGKIMKEDIICETDGEVDLTLHPTRARVLMVNDEVISIDLQYVKEHGYTGAKLMTEITVAEILKSIEYSDE